MDRRPLALVAIGLIGLVGCTSNPSARTVGEDMIDALPELSAGERTCLEERLDGYDDDELKAAVAGTEQVDWGSESAVQQAPQAFRDFVEDLRGCMDGG